MTDATRVFGLLTLDIGQDFPALLTSLGKTQMDSMKSMRMVNLSNTLHLILRAQECKPSNVPVPRKGIGAVARYAVARERSAFLQLVGKHPLLTLLGTAG